MKQRAKKIADETLIRPTKRLTRIVIGTGASGAAILGWQRLALAKVVSRSEAGKHFLTRKKICYRRARFKDFLARRCG